MARIGVLGIGNVLMGDDALGPYVVKMLDAAYEFPPDVELLDLGTPGADLSLHFEGLEAAVVVDTVRMGGSAGQVKVLDRAAILARKPLLAASPHDPGLREALFALEFQGGGPRDIRLVGVIPDAVGAEVGLSPAVRAAVPDAMQRVLDQLVSLGAQVRARAVPREPDLWWERRATSEQTR